MTKGKKLIDKWFTNRKWKAFDYQKDVWKNVLDGKNGLLNAPTGSGKTFALFMPVLVEWINQHPDNFQDLEKNGLQLIWITPLRALAKDIESAMQQVVDEIGIPWSIQRRTGDVSSSVKLSGNQII